MCNTCKKYCLDHTTISADLNYVLHEESSEKACFNGVRDKDRKRPGGQGEGMRLDDFMKLRQATETNLTRDEVSLQHTATYCNISILLVTRFRCNTLQHIYRTHDEVSLQHTAKHCNISIVLVMRFCCNTLQHTATSLSCS